MNLTKHILLNILVFLAFFGIAFAHHWIVHKRHPTSGEHVGHALLSGAFTPASFDAVREFIVHLVVYSGYIVPPH